MPASSACRVLSGLPSVSRFQCPDGTEKSDKTVASILYGLDKKEAPA